MTEVERPDWIPLIPLQLVQYQGKFYYVPVEDKAPSEEDDNFYHQDSSSSLYPAISQHPSHPQQQGYNGQHQLTNEQKNEQKNEEKRSQQDNGLVSQGGLVMHTVCEKDTLAYLSLLYGTTVSDIKIRNNIPLYSDGIYDKKVLKIMATKNRDRPQASLVETQEHKEKRLLTRLKLRMKCSEEECKFYLTECGWDYKEAVRKMEEDMQWEINHPKKKK